MPLKQNVQFSSQLDVFSISAKKHLRSCGTSGELSPLGADEYFSFTLYIHNSDTRPYVWSEAYVRVDGGQPLRWPQGQVKPGARGVLRISPSKMAAYATPGIHNAVWYFDGMPVHREQFQLSAGMNWAQVFPMPSREQNSAM